ncbi:MAG: lipid-A-disaccharide synthase [Phycisphaerales bacterium]
MPTDGASESREGPAPRAGAILPDGPPGVLFTAFEPSGDDHAAAVVAELRARRPDVPIFAWGGPRMAAAGARLIERTGDDAVMGMPGLSKILEHKRINARIARWLDDRSAQGGSARVALHVPVDSPAANFPICRITKARGISVLHLVAPQMWAWGSWRVKKLRRLTDKVLCLLPFEEDWFLSRGVPATFIGHPLFDSVPDDAALQERALGIDRLCDQSSPASISGFQTREDHSPPAPGAAATEPIAVAHPARPKPAAPLTSSATVRLALMPGSRPSEISGCFPILLDAFNRLRRDFPSVRGVLAATKPAVVEALRRRAAELGGWPDELHAVAGDTDAVIRWCDFALVVSGTVTLQIAKQHRPMTAVYRPNRLFYYSLGRWLVSTRFFTLPNLIAGKKIIQEFIPHFGDGEDLAVEVIRLLRQPGYAEDQRRELARVCDRFKGHNASRAAVDEIERALARS